jgi:hypothetical protein
MRPPTLAQQDLQPCDSNPVGYAPVGLGQPSEPQQTLIAPERGTTYVLSMVWKSTAHTC